jgi:hypothetical protein
LKLAVLVRVFDSHIVNKKIVIQIDTHLVIEKECDKQSLNK